MHTDVSFLTTNYYKDVSFLQLITTQMHLLLQQISPQRCILFYNYSTQIYRVLQLITPHILVYHVLLPQPYTVKAM